MKTYPLLKDDGTLHAFEITSTWITFRPLLSLLNCTPGVSDVQRRWFNEDRITFKYNGLPCVVNEPWGDNSRFWVGFDPPELSSANDLSALHQTFVDA